MPAVISAVSLFELAGQEGLAGIGTALIEEL